MKYILLLLTFLASIAQGQHSFIDLDYPDSLAFDKILAENKVIAIGEIHGSTEVPLFVLDLVKKANQRSGDVTVALEISSNYQKDIDAFLLHGQTDSLKTLRYFQYPDGRSSTAMVELISGLRKMKGVRIACFDVEWGTADGESRDSLMGINLNQAYDGKQMVILTGNIHSTIDLESMRPGFKSAVYHFRELSNLGNKLLALNTYFGGGTIWNCRRDGCKEYNASRVRVKENNGLTNFIRYDKSKVVYGYNGFVFFNTIRASKPFSYGILKLRKVVQQFQTAISEKDSVTFNRLFFNNNVPFAGIMSKETEASIKKNYPEFQGISVSNNRKFIREVCSASKPMTEKFYKPNIETDGVIAAISFAYSFYSGDKMIQWGDERWNLVRIEEEWFITDVIYSIRFPHIEAFPYSD